MKNIFLILILTISSIGFAQDNYIVKTEDGRRVLLKADFTWEYIDLDKNETAAQAQVVKETLTPKKNTSCGFSGTFTEPKLNKKIQNQLKRGRATISHIKKKVAKDNNCSLEQVVLLSASETKERGKYEFCANGNKVTYKRMGNSILKAMKLF